MEGKKQHFHHIMLYYYKKSKKSPETQKLFVQCMEKGAVIDLMCQKCFVKFCAGDSSLYDALWLSRPFELDSNHTETLIENNQHYTMREIAGILKISKSSVENHLHHFGYVYFSDVCVPHKLSGGKKNFLDHTSTCNSLLKHKERVLLIKHIVTGNEK